MSEATATATDTAPRAAFHDMSEGVQEDWAIIGAATLQHGSGLPDRVLTHLKLLSGDFGGFAVDRLTHCLQTAARAEKAGRPDDYILAALIHDIGDTLGPYNHADIATAIIRPFVQEDLEFMVAKHAEFQGYYFFHFLGLDRDRRDRYSDSPYYDLTMEFCADYDSPSFDPNYDTPPLEHFEPLIRAKMTMPVRSIYTGTL